MKIAIDTNRYSDADRGEPEVLMVLRAAETIFIPFIVLAELRFGFMNGSRSAENERKLSRFVNSPRVELLFSDEATTKEYARVASQLRKQGTPIPTNDLWVAALTIQHGLTLYARDGHFDHLPQIARI